MSNKAKIADAASRHRWPEVLRMRADLFDECERIVAAESKESRALTAEERARFAENEEQVRDINARLAEYKAQQIAEYGTNATPFPF
jgi:hypothetical protein